MMVCDFYGAKVAAFGHTVAIRIAERITKFVDSVADGA